uniref:Uncharacterized protein n=1 Tax=viral metagenome TaxID=1070528 RepID=A0A6C0F4A5_9ZZZZ
MASVSCSSNILILVAIVILCIAFTDEILESFPVLIKLFTDPINYLLVISLVILVILIDMPSGIILAFLVLYISIYINRVTPKRRVNFSNVARMINNDNMQVLTESEFIYNNTKPFPNKNLAPFQPTDTIPTTSPQAFPSSQNDFITSVGPPSRDGYDVSGCRYDFKNSPQNFTKYGPPLAQCKAYSASQAKSCGIAFYPLNA